MNIFQFIWSLVGPQPSLHATRQGDYTFSYRKEVLGPLHYFTIKDAISEAEARMLAERKMTELVASEGALHGSHRLATAP